MWIRNLYVQTEKARLPQTDQPSIMTLPLRFPIPIIDPLLYSCHSPLRSRQASIVPQEARHDAQPRIEPAARGPWRESLLQLLVECLDYDSEISLADIVGQDLRVEVLQRGIHVARCQPIPLDADDPRGGILV